LWTWDTCLLDIGEIVDHHCLISIFRMDKKDLFEKVKPLVEHNLTVEQKAKLYDDWGATYEETTTSRLISFNINKTTALTSDSHKNVAK
jgi:hypothetical protein